ncbi:MAG: Swt1 family HEPN domain-containing protein, partial [Ruminococcus sp.]|nr:Swt1 family HEPN domain-containing protein [Ruminococcus sp.]
MAENYTLIQKGFRFLLDSMAPYIARELSNELGKYWWQDGVMDILYDEQKRDLPMSGDWAKLVDSLDIARCLLLFDIHWQNIFRKKLPIDCRTWSKELIGVRNKLAHLGGNDFTDDDTWRALDTMSRVCDQLDSDNAEEIRRLLRTFRYGSENGSTAAGRTEDIPAAAVKKTGILESMPLSGLPCWRDVIRPHPDVAQGRYKKAEFAADIAQVARGEGAYEYRDPVEFFSRTYITEGLTGLLEQAVRRVCGKDGDPVIQLKTAFGGGKTHSMLALFHLLRGKTPIEKIPNIKPVLERAGVSSIPKANVAVLVGTALNPTKSKRPQNFPGITINTLWGEMAAQLAESAGDPKLYDYVKEADKKGVAPGSEELKNLFDACGPCLVLMDELVAYAKTLYGAQGLPAGTFDNFIT